MLTLRWTLRSNCTVLVTIYSVQVKVQALAFSHDDQYLASLGGQDDNSLVVWDVASGSAKCGSPTCSDSVLCVSFFNRDNSKIVTAGSRNMDVWDFDPVNRKVRPTGCQLGQLKRVVETIVIDESVSIRLG